MFRKRTQPSAQQQAYLDIWQREVDAICTAQKLGKVKVVPDFNPSQSLRASISGSKMTIGKGMLECASENRLYIIGHELGHRKRGHEKWFWLAVIVGLLLGSYPAYVVGARSLAFHLASGSSLAYFYGAIPGVALAMLGTGLVLIPYGVLKSYTLLLEWQADESGAQILDEYKRGQGCHLMVTGMQMQMAKQINKQPDREGYHRRFYGSKMDKLKGRCAALWVS